MCAYVIKEIRYEELANCTTLIRQSFITVAQLFGLTPENCPTNGAFMRVERLQADWAKGDAMFGLYRSAELIGFMQLEQKGTRHYELKKLAVRPQNRHIGYGAALVAFARKKAAAWGADKITIGIIDENVSLKRWYRSQGFVDIGRKNFPHLPFIVGFMELKL